MKIYGFTFVNSEGLGYIIDGRIDGRETDTQLFTSREQMLDAAYGHYVCTLDEFGTEDIESDVLDEETFKNSMSNNGYEVAQWDSFHCQWEAFEQEI